MQSRQSRGITGNHGIFRKKSDTELMGNPETVAHGKKPTSHGNKPVFTQISRVIHALFTLFTLHMPKQAFQRFFDEFSTHASEARLFWLVCHHGSKESRQNSGNAWRHASASLQQ